MPTPNRPWPVPRAPWIMEQTWRHLLFLHYPVLPNEAAALLPSGMEPDTYDGSAWISIVPFLAARVRLRGLPPVPLLSVFPELNVRTYVTLDGKPGVYFFSLDAHSLPTVLFGGGLFHLAYRYAEMSLRREDGAIHFSSRRAGDPDKEFDCVYEPFPGPAEPVSPGTLAFFLLERYCLYTASAGKLYRGDIDHSPWQVSPTRFTMLRNGMSPGSLSLPEPVLAHYADRKRVRAWYVDRIR